MKTWKAVQTGADQAEVRAGSETFFLDQSQSWSQNKQFQLRNTGLAGPPWFLLPAPSYSLRPDNWIKSILIFCQFMDHLHVCMVPPLSRCLIRPSSFSLPFTNFKFAIRDLLLIQIEWWCFVMWQIPVVNIPSTHLLSIRPCVRSPVCPVIPLLPLQRLSSLDWPLDSAAHAVNVHFPFSFTI